jgi:CrcB protein
MILRIVMFEAFELSAGYGLCESTKTKRPLKINNLCNSVRICNSWAVAMDEFTNTAPAHCNRRLAHYSDPMHAYLLVAVGGGIGAMGRFGLAELTRRFFGVGLPVATLSTNVLGGLLMGLLIGALSGQGDTQSLRLFLGVGVLGGFTTFSAFSLEAMIMLEEGRYSTFATYVGGSVILSIAAVALGLIIARRLFA